MILFVLLLKEIVDGTQLAVRLIAFTYVSVKRCGTFRPKKKNYDKIHTPTSDQIRSDNYLSSLKHRSERFFRVT